MKSIVSHQQEQRRRAAKAGKGPGAETIKML